MTTEQIDIATNLGRGKYAPGTFDKRFANDMAAMAKFNCSKELTERQNEMLYRLLYKYRKQLASCYEKYKTNPLCKPKQKA